MAKRYYNLERETKEYLKACEAKNVAPFRDIKDINDIVIIQKSFNKDISFLRDLNLNGCVLWLDAGIYSSYPGTGNSWFDISGKGNNGTLTNGPTFSNANGGGTIVFDGNNDLISFNNLTTQTLNLTSSNGATLCCWLNLKLLNRWTGVITFFTGSVVDIGWDINPSNVLRIWKNASAIQTLALNSYNNIWTYYVLVSNSTGTIFYINGSQFTATATTGNVTFNAGRYLMFGDHWDNPISGNTSLISIYDRALTSTEVLQNYNATKGRFGL